MKRKWGDKPFIDYLGAVDDRLEKLYGITSDDTSSDDTSLELIAAAQEEGDSPKECVEFIAEKYGEEQ